MWYFEINFTTVEGPFPLVRNKPYTLPPVQNLLPALNINENQIEDQVEWFKNLQQLEKANNIDPLSVEVVEVNTPN